MHQYDEDEPITYILDVNIWIEYLKGNPKIIQKIQEVGLENCFLIDFVVAKLRFQAKISDNPEENSKKIGDLFWSGKVATMEDKHMMEDIHNHYGDYKTKLYQQNKHMDMLCLLLATFAYPYHIMVTDRVDEFIKFDGLTIENWLV